MAAWGPLRAEALGKYTGSIRGPQDHMKRTDNSSNTDHEKNISNNHTSGNNNSNSTNKDPVF